MFVLSAAFIAYAPDYIQKINGFSADISNVSLSIGTKIVMPNTKSKGKDSVDLIRDSLFSIQVKQPWLLLQYDNSDIKTVGENRVESLLSTSPDTNNRKDREDIVKSEIEDKKNTNLTITKTINRLWMVFFLFIFNIGISDFKTSVIGTRKTRQQERKDKENKRRMTIAECRSNMEQARKSKTQNSTEPIEKLNGGNSDNPILNKERKIVKKDGIQRKIERKLVSDKQSNRTSNIEKPPAKVEYSVSTEKEFNRKSIKEKRKWRMEVCIW